MSRTPFIPRATPLFTAWIRRNHRLLSSSSASSALHETYSSPSSPANDVIHLTDSAVMRMKELQASEGKTEELLLRLGVEAGGCSGFQYVFYFDSKVKPDDRVFEEGGVKLVVDNISYDFVKGATVDYVEELIRSAFAVTANPSAMAGCSCKSSFMVKQ
uniref:Uncharacterized protein MANES_08G025200 n=1 Tax=Rhizophora mucronata TaxID=61149 RepID=A0A2P2IY70_RHIMU